MCFAGLHHCGKKTKTVRTTRVKLSSAERCGLVCGEVRARLRRGAGSSAWVGCSHKGAHLRILEHLHVLHIKHPTEFSRH